MKRRLAGASLSLSFPLLLPLLSSACVSLFPEEPAAGPVVRIQGRVVYAEPTSLPSGATLRVALLDLGRTEVEEAVVAYQDTEPSGRKWSPFLLQIPAGLLEPDRSYGLSARITDSRGLVLWETDRVRPVAAHAALPVELVVRRPDRTATVAPPAARTLRFDCEGLALTVHVETDHVRLVLPDRTLVLDRVPGTAAQEYRDAGAVVRLSGNALFLELGGRVYRSCEPGAP